MNEAELKLNNQKAWNLIYKLEEENSLLRISIQNLMFELNNLRLKKERQPSQEIEILKKKNKLLRKLITKQYGISIEHINKMVEQNLKQED